MKQKIEAKIEECSAFTGAYDRGRVDALKWVLQLMEELPLLTAANVRTVRGK